MRAIAPNKSLPPNWISFVTLNSFSIKDLSLILAVSLNLAADDVLREVWRIKDELSAAYGHNLDRLFAEARERQRISGRPSV